jgi:hypothetical protein
MSWGRSWLHQVGGIGQRTAARQASITQPWSPPMNNITQILQAPPPREIAVARASFPQRDAFHPSPPDWRDEVLYFLLPDRFSDGQEHTRPVLGRTNIHAQRAAYAAANGLPGWRWDIWKQSGEGRFQGGTLAGITVDGAVG